MQLLLLLPATRVQLQPLPQGSSLLLRRPPAAAAAARVGTPPAARTRPPRTRGSARAPPSPSCAPPGLRGTRQHRAWGWGRGMGRWRVGGVGNGHMAAGNSHLTPPPCPSQLGSNPATILAAPISWPCVPPASHLVPCSPASVPSTRNPSSSTRPSSRLSRAHSSCWSFGPLSSPAPEGGEGDGALKVVAMRPPSP